MFGWAERALQPMTTTTHEDTHISVDSQSPEIWEFGLQLPRATPGSPGSLWAQTPLCCFPLNLIISRSKSKALSLRCCRRQTGLTPHTCQTPDLGQVTQLGTFTCKPEVMVVPLRAWVLSAVPGAQAGLRSGSPTDTHHASYCSGRAVE